MDLGWFCRVRLQESLKVRHKNGYKPGTWCDGQLRAGDNELLMSKEKIPKKEKIDGKKTSGKAVKIIRCEVWGDESQGSVGVSSS